MAFFNHKDILAQTEGGLTIIKFFYPDAEHALSRRDKKFKIRNEKTASAAIRKKGDDYFVTDFGGDQKERNAINICMLETGKDFKEACDYLGARFHISSKSKDWKPIIPKMSERPVNDKDDVFAVKLKDFTDDELSLLGPAVQANHCLNYHLHSVESYERVKPNVVKIIASTPEYPIYAFNHEGWTKLYQPLSYEKQWRFSFLGVKPKRHIYGLELLKKKHADNAKQIADSYDEDKKDVDTDPRVDQVFICSGGSDGINMHSFGRVAIWFNSESEMINYQEYRMLLKYAKEIVYVADLDHTGLQQAVKLGLTFLDIKILMLPRWLLNKRDRRGNPCKDFKDFVVSQYNKNSPIKFNNQLQKLIDNALPCQFWGVVYKGGRNVYHVKWTQLFNFLKLQGFGRIKDEHTKDGFHYVRKNGNVVSIVRPHEIESFVHDFLRDRGMEVDLRDRFYSQSLTGTTLSKLDTFNIDFSIADKAVQYMFFKNTVWEISKKEITTRKLGEVERFVWEEKVIDQTTHLQAPHFKISEDKHGDLDIEILKKDNKFLNYLINVSRIHWRKDLEDSFKGKTEEMAAYASKHKFDIAGPNLDDNEILEQKLHLINKIYSYGYMLHTYKSPQRPWALYAMDSKVADISESHGGSGKSVYLKSLQNILKNNHYVNGRDTKKTQDDFLYHGVTEETAYTLVDDCHQYMDYGFFFNAITGDMEVNNKNGLRYIIPFDRSPKMAFASNYPPHKLDPSLERRLLFIVFSDYYHYNQDGEYRQARTISDDFDGKTLFKEFTEEEWNDFHNFCAQAVQFFLGQHEKMDPPMGNVTKRNLLAEMGEPFKNWADVYFSPKLPGEQSHLDKYVEKILAFEDFKRISNQSKTSAQRFKKSLKAYCKLQGWSFNPVAAGADSAGERIMKSRNGTTGEMIYIQTHEFIQKGETLTEGNTEETGNDDIPFYDLD